MLTPEEKDRFIAEVALKKDVDIDKLSAMEADSYTQILKNAQRMEKNEVFEKLAANNGIM